MSSLGSRIASDFTFYIHNGFILIRPETARAQQHVEQNRAEYEKWLFKFYFGDGSQAFSLVRDPEAGSI